MPLAKIFTKQVSLLTMFSALAYAMAYYFQKGVASYYGYPDLFIKIDLNTLLYSAVWLLFFSFLFLGALYAALMFDLKGKYYVPFIVFIVVMLMANILYNRISLAFWLFLRNFCDECSGYFIICYAFVELSQCGVYANP